MKKLFISCPMKGRTDEAIRTSMTKLHKLAEIIMGEELEVIDSLIEDAEIKESMLDAEIHLWYLGESLKMLSRADVMIGCPYIGCGEYTGCEIEYRAAQAYGIKTIGLSEDQVYRLMPDVSEAVSRHYSTVTPKCEGPIAYA